MAKNFDIETYCSDNLERSKKTSTDQIIAVCPWCDSYGPFYVNSKNGHYICFKCEEKGRYLVGVVSKVENLSWHNARAFLLRQKISFKRKGTILSLLEKIKKLRFKDDKKDFVEKVEAKLPKEFIPVYKNNKWRYPTYLKQRKIKRQTAKVWELGFCNFGFYSRRIIIPIKCPNGFSFTARDVTGKQEPPYMNPKGVDQGQLLLGWNMIDKNSDLTIVEGPLDAIKLWQYGLKSVALGGKVLHPLQVKMLISLSSNISVTIMLDSEEKVAPYNVANQLLFYFDQIYIASLKEGDPGSSTPKQAYEAFDNSKPYNGERNARLVGHLQNSRESLNNRYY